MAKKNLFEAVKNFFQINSNFAKNIIDLRIDYYGNWFSDWLFIKNTSKETFTIIENDNKKLRKYDILPGDTIRLSFGNEPDDARMMEETLGEIEDGNI